MCDKFKTYNFYLFLNESSNKSFNTEFGNVIKTIFVQKIGTLFKVQYKILKLSAWSQIEYAFERFIFE